MNDRPKNLRTAGADATDAAEGPVVVDRETFQAELDALRVREKAHTHERDAIAAARRRLPMIEVDSMLPLIGPHGPVTLLDVFEGRRALIAYYFMWYPGDLVLGPAVARCAPDRAPNRHVPPGVLPAAGRPGVRDLLDQRSWRRGDGQHQFVAGLDRVRAPRDWEDSSAGWRRRTEITGEQQAYRSDGRPISQWSRLEAGRSDDLGTAGV